MPACIYHCNSPSCPPSSPCFHVGRCNSTNDAQAAGLKGSFFTPKAIDANQIRPSDESIPSAPQYRKKI